MSTLSEDSTGRTGPAGAGSSAGTPLRTKAVGCLTAAAVGDALGGATEGRSPVEIRKRWGGWVEGIVPHFHGDGWRTERPMSPYHKADGHTTDDTLMTHLLARVYVEQERHLDAWDIAEHLVPKLLDRPTWIPELEREEVPIRRLFLAEAFLALRLRFGNADPREAGVGNMVNCGAAMYVAPVGIVNAGDPDGAYAEAVGIAGAHQSSYGREAAAVFAAAVAEAMTPGAGIDDVFGTVHRLAKDGTRAAIDAVLAAAESVSHWTEAVERNILRDAVRPFDTVGDDYAHPDLGARRPSRVHAIEELPVALGMLKVAAGEPRAAILGGVNYGRDADSIATMAGALAGAVYPAAVPQDLVVDVASASRLDLTGPAVDLADAAARIRVADLERARIVRSKVLECLGEDR